MLMMAIEAKTGATAMYGGCTKNANLERIARLVKDCWNVTTYEGLLVLEQKPKFIRIS